MLPMKIQLLLPFINHPENDAYLREFVPAEVDIVGLAKGRIAETLVDVSVTLKEEIEAIEAAEKDGYAAVVVGCALDPGVREAREIVKIPVIGCFEATLHLAAILGKRLCTIVPSGQYGIRMQKQHAQKHGFQNVSFRSVQFFAEQSLTQALVYKNTGRITNVIELVIRESIEAIERYDADVLAMGCNALAWTIEPACVELKKRGYEIPFIFPITASLELAKSLVNLRYAEM